MKRFGAVVVFGFVSAAVACSSSSSSSGGSGSGCAGLTSCCGTLPSADQSGCNQIASSGDEGACNATIDGLHMSHQCEGVSDSASSSGGSSSGASGSSTSSGASGSGSSSGGTSTAVASCQVASQNVCYVFLNGPPETAGGDGVKCSAELGGQVVSSCPTAGLLGCCTYSSPSDYECYYTGSGAKGCSGGTGVNNWSSQTLPGGPGWGTGSSGSSSSSSSGSSSGSSGGSSSSANGVCQVDPAETTSPCTAPLIGSCVYTLASGDAPLCTETAGDSSLMTTLSNQCAGSSTNPGVWNAGMTCAQALGSTPVAGGCMVGGSSTPSTYCQTQYWGMGTAAPNCFSCSGVCALNAGSPCVKP